MDAKMTMEELLPEAVSSYPIKTKRFSSHLNHRWVLSSVNASFGTQDSNENSVGHELLLHIILVAYKFFVVENTGFILQSPNF